MSNEEFDNLKEELMWEGSIVVMLSRPPSQTGPFHCTKLPSLISYYSYLFIALCKSLIRVRLKLYFVNHVTIFQHA